MHWGHLVWAVIVGALLTSAVVVMGTFGLVSPRLSDFALLLYMRLALLSGASYLVFNRVSFRQKRVETWRRSEQDHGIPQARPSAGKRSGSLPRHRPRRLPDMTNGRLGKGRLA